MGLSSSLLGDINNPLAAIIKIEIVPIIVNIDLAETRQRITEFEALETEYRREDDMLLQLTAIVESSNDAVVGTTLDGTITIWNSAAEKLYGYPKEEAAKIAVREAVAALTSCPEIESVLFVCFNPETREAYRSALQAL